MSAAVPLLLFGGGGAGYEIYKRSLPSGQDLFVDAVPATTLTYTLGGLSADSISYYYVDAVSDCGVRSILSTQTRMRRVAMDGDNQLIAPTPNPPYALKLTRGAGGRVTASWQHSNTNGEASAASFNVYVATGATAFDYDSVDHNTSTKSQDLGTFAEGTTVRAVVRAVTTTGDEETNTNQVGTTAVADPPATPTNLVIL